MSIQAAEYWKCFYIKFPSHFQDVHFSFSFFFFSVKYKYVLLELCLVLEQSFGPYTGYQATDF